MNTFNLDALETFVSSVLRAAGMREQNARTVAKVMVDADRYSVPSHGIARLATYLDRVDHGSMAIDPDMTIERESPATALLDAQNGFGQLGAAKAMDIAITKARNAGVGVVSVAHSNHCGLAGYYARMAAEAGFVGISMTNASPAMPPFNAKKKLLGTNPMAIGMPAANQPVAVLDMSSTIVARGKIRRALAQGHESIPEGWANDTEGRPTTDPTAALAGSLAPIGGPKGAGLALMIDLLSGALSGSDGLGQVANLLDPTRVAGTGHFLLALDPDSFVGREQFTRTIDSVLHLIRELEGVDGGKVYYPGLIEHERRQSNEASGVSLTGDSLESLQELSERFEVALPA